MYLENVRIKNFKSLVDLNVNFQKGFNLILGDNGFGKSNILKAIALGLNSFLLGIRGVKTSGIQQDDIRIQSNENGDSYLEWIYCLPTEIFSTIMLNNEKIEWTRVRKLEKGQSKTLENNNSVKKYLSNLLNKEDSILPLLSYQSDTRVWNTRKSHTKYILKNSNSGKRIGYIGCLESTTDFKTIENWCFMMEVASYQYKKEFKEYEMFKFLVSIFMEEMCDLKATPNLLYDVRKEILVYSENNTKFEAIHNLSAGYQSLLWMVIDIAYRLVNLNPSSNNIQNISGIVLIDEIDMHLHPNWQWKIVTALTKTFPKIQFIATTHSPIVISSTKNANIIRLDSKQNIYYLPNSYASRINDILILNQGSTDIPPKLQELDKEFEKALLQRNSTLACHIFFEMVNLFGKDNPVVRAAELDLDDCC